MSVETRLIGLPEPERPIQETAGEPSTHAASNLLDLDYRSGDVIAGRYRLVQMIGRGGMGAVWEAHSDALDIRVAIKLIHRSSVQTDEHQRLIFEAKAAARLADPGVVRVFDCGETLNGEPYIVMEYLEGQDLATRLDEQGRMAPIEAVRTLLPIVRALGTAHAATIVHRDVKPENVFLTRSANGEVQPKLLDFGIAKMEIPWEKRLTQAGSALGSPNYMSPEQARGEEVDQRADLWAMSVVLYETITDRLPFDGNGYNAVMYSILTSSPPPFSELGIDEPELWAIVARGFERDLSLRWQTSGELVQELSEWLIARGVDHDVTGVSLRAALNNNRTSRIRTLESVRPLPIASRVERKSSAGSSAASSSALTLTTAGLRTRTQPFWHRRPRWFVAVMSALVLCAAAAGLYHTWKNTRAVAVQPVSSVERATPSSGLPTLSVPVPVPATLPAAPAVTGPASSSAGPSSAASVWRKPSSNAPKAPPKKATSAPKGDAFKSPFD